MLTNSNTNIKPSIIYNVTYITYNIAGARGSVVLKALCYKLEGHGFDSR
jgi:hypothetical protein